MKNFRQQHHRPKKNTLVVGRAAVIRAMKEGQQLDRIYMQATVHGETVDEIKKLASENMVPINKVPVEKLNNLNVSNHEGFVGLISKVQFQDLQQVNNALDAMHGSERLHHAHDLRGRCAIKFKPPHRPGE